MKILKSSVKKVVQPVQGIFQAIFRFFISLLGGRLLVGLVNFLQNPRNAALLKGIGNFIQGNNGLILGGVAAAGIGLLTLGTALTIATNIFRAAQLGLAIVTFCWIYI